MHNTHHRLPNSRLTFLLVPLAAALCAAAARADDWPSYRGDDGTGVSHETGVFSDQEAYTLEIAWKKPIGSGYSGVSVEDGRAVTMFSDGTNDVMAAFDIENGHELWRFKIEPTYEGHDGSYDGPVATPLIAGDYAIGLSARGRLFGVAMDTGELAWSVNLVDDYGVSAPYFGFGTSPILLDGVAVVELGAKDAVIAGFDPATGSRRWAVGANESVQYASPIIYDYEGKPTVLASTEQSVTCVDAAAGKQLWTWAHGAGQWQSQGSWCMSVVPAGDHRLFMPYRTDESMLVTYAPGADGPTFEKKWENRNIRKTYNVPVYYDGHVYGVSNRFLTCLDADTGESAWRSREPGDGFTIIVDGHLVVMTKMGTLHIAPASPEGFHEQASVKVFEDLAWSPPSFADGSFYVRGLGEMARVNIKRGVATAGVDLTVGEPPANSKFAKALANIRAADDKMAAVDALLAEHETFPIFEGNNWVHFVYRGEANDMAIAGDMFGARQDRPMNRVDGTDLFYHSVQLEPDARLNYVFIRDYEETVDPRNPRKTVSTLIGKDQELAFFGGAFPMSWFAMPQWKSPAHLDAPEPTAKGTVVDKSFHSEVTGADMPISIYLPAGYDDGDNRYPVAVVMGGKAAIEHGQYPQILDTLIDGKQIDPVIVAFANPPMFGQEQKNREMIVKDLYPYLASEFRTIDSPAARACIGMGMSGTEPFFIAMANPTLIGKIGSQSPFAFGTTMKLLRPLITDGDKMDLTIYLDWGKYDLRNPHEAWDIAAGSTELSQLLRDKGYAMAGGQANDGTGWSSWKNRADKLLVALFPVGSTAGM